MMSNKIIQSLWIGNKASVIEHLCIKSFLDNGHEFHLYVYNGKVENCPVGTVFKDANEIIPEALVYKDIINRYTSFANWFRYKLLYERGGWWVDMDVICLREFNFNMDYCFTTEVIFDNGSPMTITNNAIIKAPKNAEFLSDMLGYMWKRDLKNAKWGEFGARFLERILKQYDSEAYIQPTHVFCPINWHETELFFKENVDLTFENTYAIHLWNNIWSGIGIDKNATFHPTSIIEKLKMKYL